MTGLVRCGWVPLDNPLYVRYHDEEWGTPQHHDGMLFEQIVLQGAQAGLSWGLILARREGYRRAYDGFDPALVAAYGAAQIEALLADPGLVRNRAKIESSVRNARAFLAVQAEFGSFDAYLWDFVGGKPHVNRWRTLDEIPTQKDQSRVMSKDLKKRGFSFVGPTICYALMQACGLVNDHTVDCFRHAELAG